MTIRARFRRRFLAASRMMSQVSVRGAIVSCALIMAAGIGCQSTHPVRNTTTSPPSNETTTPLANPQDPSNPDNPQSRVDHKTRPQEWDADGNITPVQFEDFDRELPPPETDATEPAAFTLAQLEGLAFQHNPTLVTAAARMQAACGKQLQAGLYPNPIVGYHATEVGNLGTAGQQGGFVLQRFITGGKLQLDQAIAGKEFDEAHFRFHAQERRVLSDVRVRFYTALVAQRRVDLTEELARIGDELVQATQKQLANRIGTENDLLQAEIRADESYILLDNARNQHIEAWRRLAAVVGKTNMLMAPVSGDLDSDLPNYDWESCYATVLNDHPELQAARAHIDRAAISVERAKREPIPNVDLMVSVRHHNVTQSDVANIQAGIPLPIFDKNEGNIQSAEAEWIAACKEAERIELDLQDQLAVAYRQYENARQQADRYRERMIPKAEKSLRLVSDGYDNGQVEYLTLLVAQETYLQVSLSYLDSLRELWTATSLIDGQLLAGSLASNQ